MKAYNEYMDNISVSDTLHRRFISCATDTRPVRRPIMARRYTAAFACLAVILLGVLTVPRLLQSDITPGGDQPGIITPGDTEPSAAAPDPQTTFALHFNKIEAIADASIRIDGHFWRELTEDELAALYPSLTETHAVTATANFRGDSTLFNIAAHAVSGSGLVTSIQLADGPVVLDYIIDGDTVNSYVFGTSVTAGYYEGTRSNLYFASFELGGTGYRVEIQGGEAERAELTAVVGQLVKGGEIDLDAIDPGVVPELREDALDLNEAHADPDFGAYLPETLPNGFSFESALRFINQERNSLSARWAKGMGYIDWRVSALKEDDKARITSVADTQNYDLSLYPIPRADSVPRELREIVNTPIFRIEELTLKTVQARAYQVDDAGDEPGHRMRFSVLYGDVLVEINVKGAEPEAVFEMLQQIKK